MGLCLSLTLVVVAHAPSGELLLLISWNLHEGLAESVPIKLSGPPAKILADCFCLGAQVLLYIRFLSASSLDRPASQSSS